MTPGAETQPSLDLYVNSITCPHLYEGEERWVFNAPSQTLPNTTPAHLLSGYVIQPDSTGDPNLVTLTNGYFFIPKDGVYEFNMVASWDFTTVSAGYIQGWLSVNGDYRIADTKINTPITGKGCISACIKARLVEGDEVWPEFGNTTTTDETISNNMIITFLRD